MWYSKHSSQDTNFQHVNTRECISLLSLNPVVGQQAPPYPESTSTYSQMISNCDSFVLPLDNQPTPYFNVRDMIDCRLSSYLYARSKEKLRSHIRKVWSIIVV